ncbi:hypothetical protein ACFMQL_01595 [Nonomuraea fastidiosa]|jgi:hypothetical protein|uniref:hypothetical protein n=1 Tax=Nonomuraea TaxID=83681 RepID=UPI00324AC07A
MTTAPRADVTPMLDVRDEALAASGPPDRRDQLTTRSLPRSAEPRSRVYELVRQAKAGHRPEGDAS